MLHYLIPYRVSQDSPAGINTAEVPAISVSFILKDTNWMKRGINAYKPGEILNSKQREKIVSLSSFRIIPYLHSGNSFEKKKVCAIPSPNKIKMAIFTELGNTIQSRTLML